MKKLLLSLCLVAGAFSASAQCTPDPQYTLPGVYPDSATGLPAACIDESYSERITILVPLDTTISIGPVDVTLAFDSIVVSDWQGLPTGFSYHCYDAGNTTSPVDGCAFEGNTTGCIEIIGNPTSSDIGSYQQIITTDTYTTPDSPLGEPTETVVNYYYIHILDCVNSVPSLSKSKFLVYPNPAKEVITLNGLNGIDVEQITVYNLEGKELKRFDEISGPALDMDVEMFETGVYYIKVSYNGTEETVKFVKE